MKGVEIATNMILIWKRVTNEVISGFNVRNEE